MSRYDNTSHDVAGMDLNTFQVIAGIEDMSKDIAGMADITEEIADMDLCNEARTQLAWTIQART